MLRWGFLEILFLRSWFHSWPSVAGGPRLSLDAGAGDGRAPKVRGFQAVPVTFTLLFSALCPFRNLPERLAVGGASSVPEYGRPQGARTPPSTCFQASGVRSTFLRDTGQLSSKNPRGERKPPVSVRLRTQPHERGQCSPGQSTESTEVPCPASTCSPAKMAATTLHPEPSTAEAGSVCAHARMHSHRHMSTHMHTHTRRHTHTMIPWPSHF